MSVSGVVTIVYKYDTVCIHKVLDWDTIMLHKYMNRMKSFPLMEFWLILAPGLQKRGISNTMMPQIMMWQHYGYVLAIKLVGEDV